MDARAAPPARCPAQFQSKRNARGSKVSKQNSCVFRAATLQSAPIARTSAVGTGSGYVSLVGFNVDFCSEVILDGYQ